MKLHKLFFGITILILSALANSQILQGRDAEQSMELDSKMSEQERKKADEIKKAERKKKSDLTKPVLRVNDGVKSRLATSNEGDNSILMKDCADCPEIVVIPAGSFMMGSPDSEEDRNADEGPQRRVSLKTFALGKTEVTQAQWQAIMGNNPSYFTGCNNCPVERVSWDEAQDFIQKLNAKTGKTYRLPSEAEWEYAARAGTTTAFHTGNTITPEQANFDGSYTYNGSAEGKYLDKTSPVASYAPNAWGLYDMHGNVREWTQDCYEHKYEAQPKDGRAHDVPCLPHVLRGGSWNNNPQKLRSAKRDTNTPDYRSVGIGFRLARTL
jgi:formylglycine-generating enzyme required for sulfatase activity